MAGDRSATIGSDRMAAMTRTFLAAVCVATGVILGAASLPAEASTLTGPRSAVAISRAAPRAAAAAGTPGCTVQPEQPPTGTIKANYPVALAFAPDGSLFFAERSGTVRLYEHGTARVFATVATVTTEPGGGYSERGLLGLAISPTFTRDHFVYAFYSDTDRKHQDIVRWTDCNGVGTDRTLLQQFPSGSDCCHKGGRLAFGPDGKLYATLGEEHDPPTAQNTADVRGKVLRFNADGTVPTDNPFGRTNPVWAYGFRNPFGIAFSPTGQLAVTNNGPTGDDHSPSTGYDTVIADVARGGRYEWPNCYGYSHPLAATSCGAGALGPDWSSEMSTVVPTGATFVDPAGPSALAGHLVFCTDDDGMKIFSPGSPHGTVTGGPSGCRLDVKEAPDHAVYYSDTSHIYRLAPPPH